LGSRSLTLTEGLEPLVFLSFDLPIFRSYPRLLIMSSPFRRVVKSLNAAAVETTTFITEWIRFRSYFGRTRPKAGPKLGESGRHPLAQMATRMRSARPLRRRAGKAQHCGIPAITTGQENPATRIASRS
jgi:hypothetical protein